MSIPYFTLFMIAVTVLLLVYIVWLKIKHHTLIKSLQKQSAGKSNQLQLNIDQNSQQDQLAKTAKTRYLSGVSHELRTPLNVIMGYAQILEKQSQETDPNKGKFTLIRQNCEHLNHLIEGILEFSAIEAGKLKVQFEIIDLRDLINQVSAMFQHQAEQKGLTFSCSIDKRLPATVKSDHKRLQQILLNLLNNAIKFTESGRIDFNISYRNQVATFTVKDSGRGIENSDLERIFEPFERIEHLDKPIKGTGLGLPITRLLVELMGGELTVNSQINQGSEFKVKMMLAPLQPAKHNAHQTQSKVSHALDKEISRNKHILVVDDEQSHRQLLVDILQQHEFQISTAKDAETAKQKITSNQISMAIIDVSMPEINGWQLAQWCQTNTPETKIMMLSANPRDVQGSVEQAHDVYLTKPVKINQLLHEINRLLELGWETNNTVDVIKNSVSKITFSIEHQDALINMLEIGHVKGIEMYLKNLLDDQIISEQQLAILMKPLNDMNLNTFRKLISHG